MQQSGIHARPCINIAALWTLGKGVRGGDWGILAHVIGFDVRHGCVSVPCLAYVTGLDVGNDSDERFYW